MSQNNFSIHKAEIVNLIDVLYIYNLTVKEMNMRGLFNWNQAYPSRELIMNDIRLGNLYIYVENHSVLGVACFDKNKPKEYVDLNLDNNISALYVHRLVVHPSFRNNKIGTKMMEFATKYAKAEGLASIRLDVIKSNPQAVKLYKNSNYKEIAEIFFDYQKDAFVVMERLI